MANLATCLNRPHRRLTTFICGNASLRPRNKTEKSPFLAPAAAARLLSWQWSPCDRRQPFFHLLSQPCVAFAIAAPRLNNGPFMHLFLRGAGGPSKSSAPLPFGIERVKWGSQTSIAVSVQLCTICCATLFASSFLKLAANVRDVRCWKCFVSAIHKCAGGAKF